MKWGPNDTLTILPGSIIECIASSDDLRMAVIYFSDEYFRQHRSIQYYAEALNVTSKYCSILIKKVSDKTAKEWINEYVQLEAKALLKSHRYTIQQISDMLSFPNQSFFA